MTTIQSFRDLIVWQKAMDLAVRTYLTARQLPKQDQTVLGYQLRKSAVSIPSNIAEGWGRKSTPFYIQHLWTAHGSGCELETQVEVGRQTSLLVSEHADLLIRDSQEVGKMINGLVASLERANARR
jgi:four helix bundle protein